MKALCLERRRVIDGERGGGRRAGEACVREVDAHRGDRVGPRLRVVARAGHQAGTRALRARVARRRAPTAGGSRPAVAARTARRAAPGAVRRAPARASAAVAARTARQAAPAARGRGAPVVRAHLAHRARASVRSARAASRDELRAQTGREREQGTPQEPRNESLHGKVSSPKNSVLRVIARPRRRAMTNSDHFDCRFPPTESSIARYASARHLCSGVGFGGGRIDSRQGIERVEYGTTAVETGVGAMGISWRAGCRRAGSRGRKAAG